MQYSSQRLGLKQTPKNLRIFVHDSIDVQTKTNHEKISQNSQSNFTNFISWNKFKNGRGELKNVDMNFEQDFKPRMDS